MINGKKVLLVLGAISAMNDIVKNAREKGYYAIVTDYYENSPAKKYADECWNISIDDVESIVKKAKERGVDGVMNYCIDPGQKSYQQICEKLGLPCVAGFEQFDIMTNKDRFTQCCKDFGVGFIPEYDISETYDEVEWENIEYPVIVKPVDGRASKGISLCTRKEDMADAIKYALDNSKRKKIKVEKYLNCPEICVKYVVCDGKFYLTTMADVYKCYKPDGTKVYLGTQTYPSKYVDEYLKTTHENVLNMLKSIGIKNGATSMTGFYDNGTFRFFDPSLRMGGAQDWCIANAASGVDISDCLTDFAMTGSMGKQEDIEKIDMAIAKKPSALLYFDIGVGTIGSFDGIQEAAKIPNVKGYHVCHYIGDTIKGYGTSDNVAIRFIVSCNTTEELVDTIEKVQKVIKIADTEGNNMIISPFEARKNLLV